MRCRRPLTSIDLSYENKRCSVVHNHNEPEGCGSALSVASFSGNTLKHQGAIKYSGLIEHQQKCGRTIKR